MNFGLIAKALITHGPAIQDAYYSLGAAMTEPQQNYVLAHWKELAGFIKTDEGKVAVQTFVSDWMAAKNPEPEQKNEQIV